MQTYLALRDPNYDPKWKTGKAHALYPVYPILAIVQAIVAGGYFVGALRFPSLVWLGVVVFWILALVDIWLALKITRRRATRSSVSPASDR